MTLEIITTPIGATVITLAVLDPSIASIALAALAAAVVLIPAWFKYKIDKLNAKVIAQDATIAEVKKTSDGMKDALVKSTADANLAAGKAEGKAEAEADAAIKSVAKSEGFAEAVKIKDQNQKLN